MSRCYPANIGDFSENMEVDDGENTSLHPHPSNARRFKIIMKNLTYLLKLLKVLSTANVITILKSRILPFYSVTHDTCIAEKHPKKWIEYVDEFQTPQDD